jgi:hypothetical protein
MDDIEQGYATDPRNAAKLNRTRARKTKDVFDTAIDTAIESAEARKAEPPKEYDFGRQEFQAGHHEPHHVENAEHPKPPTEEQPRKKWTPPADPFGFENHKAGDNRVQLLKSENKGAWGIRFEHNPNLDKGPDGETYSKENPHPVLKMLKAEGYKRGVDQDDEGGWGKAFAGDAYAQDHIEAKRVPAGRRHHRPQHGSLAHHRHGRSGRNAPDRRLDRPQDGSPGIPDRRARRPPSRRQRHGQEAGEVRHPPSQAEGGDGPGEGPEDVLVAVLPAGRHEAEEQLDPSVLGQHRPDGRDDVEEPDTHRGPLAQVEPVEDGGQCRYGRTTTLPSPAIQFSVAEV